MAHVKKHTKERHIEGPVTEAQPPHHIAADHPNSVEETKPVEAQEVGTEESVTVSGKAILIGLAVLIVIGLVVWRIQSAPSVPEVQSAQPTQQVQQVKDEVVARVNGQEILASGIDSQLNQIPESLKGGVDFAGILNASINEALLLQEAKKKGVEVSTEQAREFLALTLNRSGISAEELNKRAHERGLSESDLIDMFRRRLTVNNLLQTEVFTSINVSDAEVKKWYNAYKENLSVPEIVHAKHILLAQPEEANATLARLKKGASFEQLAKDMSIDKASAINGGDLGNFTKGDMVPEFEQAVFDAKEGSIIGPVKTQYGYHLIKVVRRTKGRERPLSEVASLIKKQLQTEKSQVAAKDYVGALRSKANIEWLYKG